MTTRAADAHLSDERRAVQRLRWYMLLRWAGVAVLYSAGVGARLVADLDYSLAAGNVLAPFVVFYNLVVWRLVTRWELAPPDDWERKYRLLGNAQCSLDLTVLAVALHYAGGIESWAAIQPIAVLVVAGLVLSARDSLLQGLFACALVDFVVVAEATGAIDHVDLGVVSPALVTSGRYVAGFVLLYDAVVVFIVFLVVFLTQRLREREVEVTRLYGLEHETVRRLEEVDRLKSDFLATMSHELRTPLTAIIGFAKHLNRNWERTTEPLRLEQVAAIERQSARLQRLVEDLLDFSAIEAENLRVRAETVHLSPVAEAAVSSCNLDDVDVRVPSQLTAWADPHRVEQVLVNLLDNAAKYGRRPITVSAVEDDGHVVVSVADRGEGIPADRVPDVFNRFQQLDRGPTRRASGVGLGLALVRGYVSALGGDVWYEPASPQGARFCFTLPGAPAQAGTNNGDS